MQGRSIFTKDFTERNSDSIIKRVSLRDVHAITSANITRKIRLFAYSMTEREKGEEGRERGKRGGRGGKGERELRRGEGRQDRKRKRRRRGKRGEEKEKGKIIKGKTYRNI